MEKAKGRDSMANYNNDERFEAICKIETGFDYSNLSKHYEQFNNHLCNSPKNYYYKESIKPDVWVEVKYVWEVRAAALFLSPQSIVQVEIEKGREYH